MKSPLSDAIKSNLDHISFHTPGHSGILLKEDITELSYSGNLLLNSSVIFESECEIAKVYGSENCRYITQGATSAIHIAIKAFSDKKILVVGNCHYSVFSAIRIYKVKNAFYTNSDCLDSIIDTLSPDVIYFSSVDYMGSVKSLKNLRPDVKYIVDEAHGAHFVFSKLLPHTKSIEYADVVIHSLHKTLAAPTGAAVLHYKTRNRDRIEQAICDIHSSSPSYYIMSKSELAIKFLADHGDQIYSAIKYCIDKFKNSINAKFKLVENHDFTRVVIKSECRADLVSKILEKNKIFVEAAYKNFIILIVTPYNCESLSKVADILNSVPSNIESYTDTCDYSKDIQLKKIELFDEYITVDIDSSTKHRAFRELSIYPPGIPFVFAGDEIDADIVNTINNSKESILGLVNNKVCVLI
ncbi:MAG: hypothetical protein LBF12_06260 [Christensenellaceae bacterium]|jgi:lysine decarboxylase|nr:hypothetical protein [Christensenellaceae bacterium]